MRITVAYLEANPQRLHEDFIELTLQALRKAWPCR
ncbi:MAG: Rap1a/Tai family immunity protein [Xanthobacteraceae bacterium]